MDEGRDGGLLAKVASCVHCGEIFGFNEVDELKLVKCPHCASTTALGKKGIEHVQSKGLLYCCLGVVFILLGIGVTIGTYMMAEPGGYHIFYIGGFIAGLIYLVKGLMFRSVKMSNVRYLVSVPFEHPDLWNTGVTGAGAAESANVLNDNHV